MLSVPTATEPEAGPRRGRANRSRPAAAFVSVLVPSRRRTQWWYLVRCRTCGAPHLGRAPDLEGVTGPRRLPCGHWVTVTIARSYGKGPA